MTDPPLASDLPDVEPVRGPATGTPRWVKVSGIVVLVLILLLAVSLVAIGGDHGPGRHASSEGGPAGRTPSSELTRLSGQPS